MDDIKLVAIDLDETLLTTDKHINPDDAEAIRRAREKGVHIVFASGRHLDGVKTITKILGNTDYCISSVGAIVTDKDDRLVYSNCLDPKASHEMLNYLDSIGIYTQAYPPLRHLICKKRCAHTEKYERVCECTADEVPDILEIDDADYTKLLMVDTPEKLIELQVVLRKRYPDYLILISQPDHLEIINRDASKGDALEHVCAEYGMDMKHVLAIGDGEVDIAMLQAAGHGACPKNAIASIKQCAEYISEKTNNENAIADIFNHYIFGESR